MILGWPSFIIGVGAGFIPGAVVVYHCEVKPLLNPPKPVKKPRSDKGKKRPKQISEAILTDPQKTEINDPVAKGQSEQTQ